MLSKGRFWCLWNRPSWYEGRSGCHDWRRRRRHGLLLRPEGGGLQLRLHCLGLALLLKRCRRVLRLLDPLRVLWISLRMLHGLVSVETNKWIVDVYIHAASIRVCIHVRESHGDLHEPIETR